MILFVVTAVVLAGVDINGGRGTVLGIVLALLLLGTLRNGMGLANIAGPSQTVVFGALLVSACCARSLMRSSAPSRRSRAPGGRRAPESQRSPQAQ